MTVEVSVSTTPNENALKFTLNQMVMESGHKTYASAEKAEESLIAKKLFEIDGVTSVFLIQDFITITKDPASNWQGIQEKIITTIKETL